MIKLANESFPAVDVAVFQIICKLVALLPERLDLMAENETEEELLYDPRNYYKMLLASLSFELDATVGLCTVIIGNPALMTDALALPGGSRVVLGLPDAISTGPMLVRKGPGIQFSGYNGFWDNEPNWFHIGIDLFRKALQARSKPQDPGMESCGEPSQPS